MVRPRKPRRISRHPAAFYFKPRAIPLSRLKEVNLSLDEFEATRLCDYRGLSQKEAAKKMGVSQSTLSRILNSTRKKIARALIKGEAIRVSRLPGF